MNGVVAGAVEAIPDRFHRFTIGIGQKSSFSPVSITIKIQESDP